MNPGAPRPFRIGWGLAVSLVEVAALLLIAVPTALAHATLLSASPAPGQVAPSTFRDINLIFDSLLAPGSSVALFTGNSLPVPGIVSQVERGRELAVHLAAPLSPGTYTAQWTAVTLDGHSVEGSYQFGVSKDSGVSPWAMWVPIIAGALVVAGILVVGWGWVVGQRAWPGHVKYWQGEV